MTEELKEYSTNFQEFTESSKILQEPASEMMSSSIK
jgi:hypothetical protein